MAELVLGEGSPKPLRSGRSTTLAGRRVVLRGLTRRDQAQHSSHLLRLSREDRRARFHVATKDATIEAYSRGIDWDHALIFGIFVDGTLRGVGELGHKAGAEEAEISLSVEQPFRQSGFGSTLLLALVLAARKVGVKALTMLFLSENQSMRALARDLGATSGGLAPVIHSVKML